MTPSVVLPVQIVKVFAFIAGEFSENQICYCYNDTFMFQGFDLKPTFNNKGFYE